MWIFNVKLSLQPEFVQVDPSADRPHHTGQESGSDANAKLAAHQC